MTKTDPEKGAKGTSLIVVETDEVARLSSAAGNLDKIGLKSNDTSSFSSTNIVRVRLPMCSAPRKGRLRPAHAAS